MTKVDDTLLQEMTDRLVRTFAPEQVILFGSRAWGRPDEGSDVDLYVIVSESSERPLQRARRALACLSGLQVAKDVLVRTRAEAEKFRDVYASLESQVFEKGRVLYERH
ncbi:nucleotidyltransferase domain-containing protein [Desulfuromonas acetexigens]|jgi:predicted nucleotidyltransferase|uniref:Nucleotidyltransferase domain-containing protein n=1 Tax=Trichloromonas acetexigens TaxID=38815 RepID=A0A550JF12_9BACT|nr:nucleotidyltransferase domain-containing protein [Desulfuromonas acetexigens]TRO81791.1 nucleotidyltransferase domain-containing protein [Desulfuromonas acetexigens]